MSNIYLTRDLIVEIFVRLPVKSVLRFKSLSKSWYTVINSSWFIKKHAKQSKKTDFNRKLIVGDQFYDKHMLLNDLDTEEEVKYPSILSSYPDIDLVGSCNGLLCLMMSSRIEEEEFILWNPSTQEYLKLPICPGALMKYKRGVHKHAFGYDEVTDDYKVMRLTQYYGSYNPSASHLHKCFIYSLNSSLKNLPSFDNLEYWPCGEGVYTNGALHWVCHDRSIVAFNLGSGTFQKLPTPDASKKFRLVSLQVLDGCFYLLGSYPSIKDGDRDIDVNPIEIRDMDDATEIWVMKEYGNKDSWTKLTNLNFSYDNDSSPLVPLEFFKSGKHFIVKAVRPSKLQIALYKIEEQSRSLQKLKFPFDEGNIAWDYFETLVKFNGNERKRKQIMR